MTKYKVFFALVALLLCSPSAYADYDEDFAYPASAAEHTGCSEVYDPYESVNRKIFSLNSILDYFILRPIALAYTKITNDYVKTRVSSFFDNLYTPVSVVNYAFQGNIKDSFRSLSRFAINSTYGLLGFFDLASKGGVNPEPQSFGSTLAHYGVGPGPYIVLPIFGSTNGRDFLDKLALDNALNPMKYYIPKDVKRGFTIVNMIQERAAILPFTDSIAKNSPDPYVAIRSAIHQNREFKVRYSDNFKCPVIRGRQ